MPASARSQANRLIAISTPLGNDVLLLKSIQMTEELGRPFTADLDLRSETPNINFEEIIGENVTVRVLLTGGGTRYINGYIASFSQSGVPAQGRANRYRAKMVPWLWFLTRTSDCRVFQNKTVPDIVQEVFKDFGFSGEAFIKLALSATYEPREFVVQYRETAFNFVSRLLEEEGIYYFFEHDNGKHVLVLADSPAAHNPVTGYENVPFVQQERQTVGRERVWEWQLEKKLQPIKVAHQDLDFKRPMSFIAASAESTIPATKPGILETASAMFEVFDHSLAPSIFKGGADTASMDDTDHLVKVRVEELAADYEVARSRGDVRGLVVGAKFKLTEFPRTDQERDYVVVSAYYHAETDEYGRDTGGGSDQLYQVGFTAIPATVPFRPARTTPRPVIGGPQTARVVGPSEEEIYTDDEGFGRVRVLFNWDRWNKAEEPDKCSCWVRVAQLWAGKKWGAMFLPRIGQEVIVEFMEGDPDKPVVTGRLYNGQCMPPYALPDEKTKSTIKTCSSKGGEGFNEIRFEDKKDAEQIFIHAQKDMHTRVKNDHLLWVGNDRHEWVKNDAHEYVKHDKHVIVDNDLKSFYKNDFNMKVDGKRAEEVKGSLSLTVKDDVIQKFQAKASCEVTNDFYLKADNICIEAATNITIKVGGVSIAIESDGIALKGPEIKAEADNAIKLKGGSTADLGSPNTTVKGDSSLTLKGGTVAIN